MLRSRSQSRGQHQDGDIAPRVSMGDPAEGKAGPKIDPMGRVPTRLAARPLSLLLGPWGSV